MAKNATATEVRTWAEENGLIGEGQRGRLGHSVITQFNKAHRSSKYVFNYGSGPAPKVAKVTAKADGRPPITRTVNLMEVRAAARAAGHDVGNHGRLTQDVLQSFVLGTL